MAEKRKTEVLIPYDMFERYKHLTDEQFGKLQRAIIQYAASGIEPNQNDQVTWLLFYSEKPRLDAKQQAYIEKCERNAQIAREREEQKREQQTQNQENTETKADKHETTRQSTNVRKNQKITNTSTNRTDRDIDFDNDTDSECEREKNTAAPPGLSLSQQQFHESFPKVVIDCDFKTEHDVAALIAKIHESRWLRVNGVKLSWFLNARRYVKIMADEHKDFVQLAAAPEKSKDFQRHEYPHGELNKFTDLDAVDF